MKYYYFGEYLREKFGCKVWRLGLNAGFTCPNRDGTIGAEGCIYCNEKAFSHFSASNMSLEEQIEDSIKFSLKKFKAERFIAYFQNATNTNSSLHELKKAYDVIKKFPEIVGLFVSTRPDCVDDEKLDLIASYMNVYDVWVEYGVQTVHDRTLKLLKRNHTFEDSKKAIIEAAKRGIKVSAHLILGLPGESERDMLETASVLAGLPVSGVKFHVLHVLKDTALERIFDKGEIRLLEMGEYVNIVCKVLRKLPRKCVIMRLVPDAKAELLRAPLWIRDKQVVIKAIEKEL